MLNVHDYDMASIALGSQDERPEQQFRDGDSYIHLVNKTESIYKIALVVPDAGSM